MLGPVPRMYGWGEFRGVVPVPTRSPLPYPQDRPCPQRNERQTLFGFSRTLCQNTLPAGRSLWNVKPVRNPVCCRVLLRPKWGRAQSLWSLSICREVSGQMSLYLPKRLKPAPYTGLMSIAQWLIPEGLGKLASSLEEERGDPGRKRGDLTLQAKRINSMLIRGIILTGLAVLSWPPL